MVQAADVPDRAQIRESLKAKYVAIFDTLDQHELKIEEENGNIQVRQSWDEANNVMMAFGV